MIEDLRSAAPGFQRGADVCVIGAGAAGITLALELAQSGVNVCLLESGGLDVEPGSQSLSQGQNAGRSVSLVEGRQRGLGGTTAKWGGRLAPLDPMDFEARPWASIPAWPFSSNALAPYYDRAGRSCGLKSDLGLDKAVLESILPGPYMDLGPNLKPYLWRFAPTGFRRYQDWGKAYLAKLEAAVTLGVILHANLSAFEAGADGDTIEAVIVRSLAGQSGRIVAKAFVLCCGGIENARLLLSSADDVPGGGIAKGAKALGRYFHQHPRGKAASLVVGDAQGLKLQDYFNIFSTRAPPQYEVGFALSPKAQREEELVNCSGFLVYEADPASSWEWIKSKVKRLKGGSSAPRGQRFSLADLPMTLTNLIRRGVQGRHPLQKLKSIRVMIDLEQSPDANSTITLLETRDALGMRQVRIDWRIEDAVRKTASRFVDYLATECARLGIGKIVPEPWLSGEGPLPVDSLVDNYHHMGATRMAANANDGVVDADCRVFGSRNVYVVGASVFPTGGHANPTLTIVALALRLADHLKAVLASTPASLAKAESDKPVGVRPQPA